jgi:hypothetical protein
MRRAARIDRNQPEIVAALRSVGATVQPLHTIGKGCPDALIGYRGRNLLFEIKDGLLVPSKQALTADELKWHVMWEGQVCTVNSIEAAIAALNEVTA